MYAGVSKDRAIMPEGAERLNAAQGLHLTPICEHDEVERPYRAALRGW
jgi:hypothetical protein